MSTNDTLTAKANEGSGTDALATLNLGANGKAGRVALIIDDGTNDPPNAGEENPFPVQVSGGATAAKQDTAQTTLDAIQSAAESLLIAADAIKIAAEALNTKTIAVDTGAIAGTVALDTPTLAALETTGVAVSNFPATQPISAAALPLPPDAATETTLASVNAKLPNLDSGRLPVSLPPGSSGLTDSELRASPIEMRDTEVAELTQAILDGINKLAWLGGPARALDGTLRTSIVGTPAVTVSSGTLTALNNIVQIGGYGANQHIPAITNTACAGNLSRMDG